MYILSSKALTLVILAFTRTITVLAEDNTPPACLIAAIGAQPNPSDLKALCGPLEQQITSNITQRCSKDAEESAKNAFASTCLSEASVTLVFNATSSAPLGTGTGIPSSTSSIIKPTVTKGPSTGIPGSIPGPTSTSIASCNTPLSAISFFGVGFFAQLLL